MSCAVVYETVRHSHIEWVGTGVIEKMCSSIVYNALLPLRCCEKLHILKGNHTVRSVPYIEL